MTKQQESTSTRVTLSDCAVALNSIESEIESLTREKTTIERKIAALTTQGMMISELDRRIV